MLCEDGDYLISLPIAIASVCFRLDDDLQRSNEWRESLYPRGNGDCFQFLGTGVCANLWRFIEATRYVGPLLEGSTACVVIIRGNEITVGNVGDSRCVLSRNGQAINLSTDHKPNAVHEFLRIQRAGGQVLTNTVPVIGIGQGGLITRLWDVPRVQGKLAVSRVIGYFELKQNKNEPMVICVPDINAVDITDDTEFLVIASDGIWDHMSSQEVVDFVHKELHSGEENLRATCEKLLDHCLDSRDNVTVILVRFKPGPAVIPLLSDIEEEEPNEPQHNPEDSGQQHDGDEIIPYLSDIEDEPDEPQHNPQSPGQ
ncbi:hypothetical protein E2562_018811 [Oryza meyeriana var. granulata]|uniref:protein-serine/threonine phosphatase n=1 Tax=Oryza meyeriana var. granulata TaxID=110450 RepID=A0A6G1F9N2_9ORYZ|nr:hypothetical protein E2562_018811 [Oryza meyeriana var. granulata]